MNVSAPFIKRPVMTTFVMLAIIIAGWFSFLRLPVSDLPTVEKPEIQVRAGYVGASSETMLHLVTVPLEKELANVQGVLEISSKSSPGSTSIALSFDLNKDMDRAIRDVQSAINRAEGNMPRDLSPRPYYQRQQESQEPIMYMVMISDSLSLSDLRTYADTFIIPKISRVEGVSQVSAFGEKKSVWIRVNPELMAARRVGFNHVIEGIRQYTDQMPMGSIQTGTNTLAIELSNLAKDSRQLENIEIGEGRVRLKDIAEISEKASDSVDFHFLTQERKSLALILGVQKISDANTVAVSQQIKKILETIQKDLPPTVELNLWFDKAVWIHESIVDVEWSLFFAFALVVVVIYLSLGRLSEAMIPSLALPLSLLGTFCAMYLLDFSLDLLSLLALTLSVGFVVDDAIVVLENIVRHQELGASPKEASLEGAKQIGFTVVSMTLSLVAVFIPLLFMSGMTGKLLREFSVTLAVSIMISGAISLTLTPMLCCRFLKKHAAPSRLQIGVAAANQWLVNLYGKSLKVCLRFSKTTLLVGVLCAVVTVPLFMHLPVKLVPDEDRGFFFTVVKIPAGLDREEIQQYQQTIEHIFQTNDNVASVLDIYQPGHLIFVVRLKDLALRDPQEQVIASVQQKLEKIPGIVPFSNGYNLINLDLDFGSGGQYHFLVKGLTFEEVEKAGQALAQELQAHQLFKLVLPPQKNDSPKIDVRINEEQANKMGVTKKQIQDLLKSAFGQNEVAKLRKDSTEQKVYLELLKEYQNSPEALGKVYFSTVKGEFIPLKSLITWEEKLGSPHLVHREQLPSTSIKFSLKENVTTKDGFQAVEEIAAKVLPDNVKGSFHGAATAIAETMQNTAFLLIAAAVAMYIVLGILYESFVHPLTILSSLPFACLGGVVTLLLFNEPLSIFSAVGFLLLIGIVKKNGIMMIDYAIENQKLGMASDRAIYEGCLVRFRPIMMTTVAAIMGAIPIAVGFGDGSEVRRGLGLVIVGGLFFSQLLTLYVTPAIYLLLERGFSRKNEAAPA